MLDTISFIFTDIEYKKSLEKTLSNVFCTTFWWVMTWEAFSGAQYSLKQVLLKIKLGSTEKHGLERDEKILVPVLEEIGIQNRLKT